MLHLFTTKNPICVARRGLIALACVSLLAGCGSDDETANSQSDSQTPGAEATTVFDAQLDALDKTEEMVDQMRVSDEKMRKQIQEFEDGLKEDDDLRERMENAGFK